MKTTKIFGNLKVSGGVETDEMYKPTSETVSKGAISTTSDVIWEVKNLDEFKITPGGKVHIIRI